MIVAWLVLHTKIETFLKNAKLGFTRDSNVRRSREVTEKGCDVQITAGCGDGLSAYAVPA